MEKRCPSCGRLMEADEKFCKECGTKYTAPEAANQPDIQPLPSMPPMPVMPDLPSAPNASDGEHKPETQSLRYDPTCPKCGTPYSISERFCRNCGTPLPTPAQTPISPQPDISQPTVQPPSYIPSQPNLPPMKKGNKALIIIPIILGVIIIALLVVGGILISRMANGEAGDDNSLPAFSSSEAWGGAAPESEDNDVSDTLSTTSDMENEESVLPESNDETSSGDGDYSPDYTSWEVYTDPELGFSLPVPDGWSTEPVEVDEAYGIKTVSFFSPSTELGIMVHYIAGASSADYVGQEEVNAKAAADALGYSYYWISDTSGWSTLSDYDAYNYFIIISEDEYAETSFCYDSYVIDADGGAYVVQIVRVTGTDSEYTEEYDNAMSDAYMSAVCFQLP